MVIKNQLNEDLSWLPDQSPVQKNASEDLSWLPDQKTSNPNPQDDLSFLPDQVEKPNKFIEIAKESVKNVPMAQSTINFFQDMKKLKEVDPDAYKDVSYLPRVVATMSDPLLATKLMSGNLTKEKWDILMDVSAAGAYQAAGAVKGATLGYLDPTKALEQTPLAERDISKGVAVGSGELIGSLAPILATAKVVGGIMKTAGILNNVKPILQNLVHSGITGAVYGFTKKPEEEGFMNRAKNALDDAAWFIAFTGTGALFDKGAKLLGLNKVEQYNSLKEDLIKKFELQGKTRAEAEQAVNIGLDAAVQNNGGWAEVKTSDIKRAREAIKNGENIVFGRPIEKPVEPVETAFESPPETISQAGELPGGSYTPKGVIQNRILGEFNDFNLTNSRVKADAYGTGTKYEVIEPKGDSVVVYRAVSSDINSISPGNYVTLSEKYAKDHLLLHEQGLLVENKELVKGGKIISQRIPKNELTVMGGNELIWSPLHIRSLSYERMSESMRKEVIQNVTKNIFPKNGRMDFIMRWEDD